MTQSTWCQPEFWHGYAPRGPRPTRNIRIMGCLAFYISLFFWLWMHHTILKPVGCSLKLMLWNIFFMVIECVLCLR